MRPRITYTDSHTLIQGRLLLEVSTTLNWNCQECQRSVKAAFRFSSPTTPPVGRSMVGPNVHRLLTFTAHRPWDVSLLVYNWLQCSVFSSYLAVLAWECSRTTTAAQVHAVRSPTGVLRARQAGLRDAAGEVACEGGEVRYDTHSATRIAI